MEWGCLVPPRGQEPAAGTGGRSSAPVVSVLGGLAGRGVFYFVLGGSRRSACCPFTRIAWLNVILDPISLPSEFCSIVS